MTPVMSVASLSKRYGRFLAVDGVSFDVNPGEILGFLGPNGAGKTTTVKMLSGLLTPDSGTISIMGREVSGNKDPLLHSVGLSPQELVIWQTLTCMEQLVFLGVMYGLSSREARKKGEALLEDLGLTEKRSSLASALSGGMQRRLNIALALIHGPRILILDEPQAGLDPQSRILVREYILRIKKNAETAVIITTHDMEEAEKLSDRICIIDHGKRLVLDTVEKVKEAAGGAGNCRLAVEGMPTEELRNLLESRFPDTGGWTAAGPSVAFDANPSGSLLCGITALLAEKSLSIRSLNFSQTTLEDVFIHLTGRELRE